MKASAIIKEYSTFLENNNIRYKNNKDDFYVFIELKNIKNCCIQLCLGDRHKILLTDYCGYCKNGIRNANRVLKAIVSEFPGYDIRLEHYGGGYEIEIYHEVSYKNAETLHKHVLEIAGIIDESARIGYEMLKDEFER